MLKFLLRNLVSLVSLDSGMVNGAKSPPETPRSRLGDHLRHKFGRVGKVDQVEDDDRQEKYIKVSRAAEKDRRWRLEREVDESGGRRLRRQSRTEENGSAADEVLGIGAARYSIFVYYYFYARRTWDSK